MRQTIRRMFLAATALAAVQPAYAAPMLTAQPDPTPDVVPFVQPVPAAMQDRDALIAALRQKVKYVFVVFNENHSFDNEFGTFPGADGLFSDGTVPRDAAHTPGFVEHYTTADGSVTEVRPVRVGPEQNATVVDSVDHSHTGLAAKMHVTGTSAAMDRFAQTEYTRYAGRGGAANVAMGRQFAQVVKTYIDCDTIPFLWRYATRFTIFDRIFATEDMPSTPNAIAMIAGQAGETQWVKHGNTGQTVTVGGKTGTLQPVPMFNDPQPFYGSQFDPTTTDREPTGPRENYANGNISTNLTFATIPLTLGGSETKGRIAQDRAPETDLADIAQDVAAIDSRGGKPVAWRWYQEGYDHEPGEAAGAASHDSYVSHHEGPQYFGYLANNPAYRDNLRGLGDFFADMDGGKLPEGGGVFYIRGGFTNLQGQTPPIQNAHYPNRAGLTDAERAAIALAKSGDDDHPGYSDRQLSEAMAARVVNAVASRPDIWAQSAIVITYDESDGFYDHVAPRILSFGPDGLPLARGIRIPMIVVSPYARTHVVAHAEGDHNAVIETLNAIFDLPPLASLPDEAQALAAGLDPRFDGPGGFKQHHLGPRDLNAPETDDLLAAFEPGRLSGALPPLPAALALIPDADLAHLPHYDGQGCRAIGVVPEDLRQNVRAPVPATLNLLPATLPAYN